ncbi:hypothetical protein CDCA_CDCA19G4688 [Cyanidium caldarium]|uniref:5-demethoxyubiquinone hydroxylase, mitochondrial n=1 Tax=Cyanidium caldarium TaxID=2771 RepID=A0AAV9J240_CYACA|nr:hypothetical protein CDCA_CDCA19G4688 [Cyanidium caldarium]
MSRRLGARCIPLSLQWIHRTAFRFDRATALVSGWRRQFSTTRAANADHRPEEPETEPVEVADPGRGAYERWLQFATWSERRNILDRIVRVDHAGELGARRIYAGQLAVFRGTPVGEVIQHMADQERAHAAAFTRLIAQHRVRPTLLLPLWHVAGYALGLGTALLGKESAMACTVAVEEVIADHYNDQLRTLIALSAPHPAQPSSTDIQELRALIRQFRDDELEHKHTGIQHDAQLAPAYRALSEVIKAGCHLAIYLSERV